MNFIINLLIGSLWCFGIYKLFDDLLNPIAVRIEDKIGLQWCKPLFYCPPCMASVHGVILCIIFGITGKAWIVYCVCLCGLNYIIQQFLPEYE